jgi:hypothetical protein
MKEVEIHIVELYEHGLSGDLNEEEKGNLKNLENENKQLLDLRDENGG